MAFDPVQQASFSLGMMEHVHIEANRVADEVRAMIQQESDAANTQAENIARSIDQRIAAMADAHERVVASLHRSDALHEIQIGKIKTTHETIAEQSAIIAQLRPRAMPNRVDGCVIQ